MKPADVTTMTAPLPGNRTLETWTRTYRGQPVAVSFIPSDDPGIRSQQERDLARHLDERTTLQP